MTRKRGCLWQLKEHGSQQFYMNLIDTHYLHKIKVKIIQPLEVLCFVRAKRLLRLESMKKNIIAGEYTFCEFNDQYVAIISGNRYTRREETIQTLFDLQNQKFLVGEQDILMQTFLESKKSGNKQKEKSLAAS